MVNQCGSIAKLFLLIGGIYNNFLAALVVNSMGHRNHQRRFASSEKIDALLEAVKAIMGQMRNSDYANCEKTGGALVDLEGLECRVRDLDRLVHLELKVKSLEQMHEMCRT